MRPDFRCVSLLLALAIGVGQMASFYRPIAGDLQQEAASSLQDTLRGNSRSPSPDVVLALPSAGEFHSGRGSARSQLDLRLLEAALCEAWTGDRSSASAPVSSCASCCGSMGRPSRNLPLLL